MPIMRPWCTCEYFWLVAILIASTTTICFGSHLSLGCCRWKEWNDEYLEATFPRLMVRLEDLVFFPKQVLTEICECVGGHVRTMGLTLIGDTSKKGGENVHGHNKTDLQKAMISHIYTNRTAGMSRDDVTFALSALRDSAVAKAMAYDVSSFLERTT